MISFRVLKLSNGDYKALAQCNQSGVDLDASFQSGDWHNFQRKLKEKLDEKVPGPTTERRRPHSDV